MHPHLPQWCACAQPIRPQIYACDLVMWSAALWGNSPVWAKIHVKQLYPPMNHITADIKWYHNSTGSEKGKKTHTHISNWCVFIKIFAVLHSLLVILHHCKSKFKSMVHSVLPYQLALLISRLLCGTVAALLTFIDGDCVCFYSSELWWRVMTIRNPGSFHENKKR